MAVYEKVINSFPFGNGDTILNDERKCFLMLQFTLMTFVRNKFNNFAMIYFGLIFICYTKTRWESKHVLYVFA